MKLHPSVAALAATGMPIHEIGGSLRHELERTAELMVEINKRQDMGGLYMALCLLHDTQRPLNKEFLDILKNTPGAITRKA